MNRDLIDTAIIGAGPYGLSVACHLRALGTRFRIFGSPMRFWRGMPKGIALKSFDFATNIYAPIRGYSFVDYCGARGIDSHEPVDMATFTAYGMWAQQELVPEVEDVEVQLLERSNGHFTLTLSSGERVDAARVVVAVGLRYFERYPEALKSLPSRLASHTSRQNDYSGLQGKDVTVIGGGQSALEAAALLHDHGARAQLMVRGEGVWFSDKFREDRPLIERLKYPQTVVGPGQVNWVLQHLPILAHYLPEKRRVRFTRRHLGPFGTWWLRETVEGNVPIHSRTHLLGAREAEGGVVLTVRGDEGERELHTDHVVAGTGYEVDVDRIDFLDSALAQDIARIERAPRLSRAFESSVPGLYFIGPSAAFSFGPLLRFVCGAAFAAPTLARHLARQRVPLASRAPAAAKQRAGAISD